MNTPDLKNNISEFLKNYALYIAIGVAVLIALAIVLILVLSKNKKSKKISKQDVVIDTNEWLLALGGRDNILEKNATGSRLVVKLNDPSKLNEEKLKEKDFAS